MILTRGSEFRGVSGGGGRTSQVLCHGANGGTSVSGVIVVRASVTDSGSSFAGLTSSGESSIESPIAPRGGSATDGRDGTGS